MSEVKPANIQIFSSESTDIQVIGQGKDEDGDFMVVSDETAHGFMRDDVASALNWVANILERNTDSLIEALDELKVARKDLEDFEKELASDT